MNSNEKWPIKSDRLDYATYNRDVYGPTFGGGHDLTLATDMHNGYTYAWGYAPESDPGFEGSHGDFGGSYNSWTVEEIEVWALSTTGDPLLCDIDGDGLLDSDEINVYGTDFNDPDTDDDGLNDYEELITYGSSPFIADTDDDGLTDRAEVLVTNTDPTLPDSDGDGCDDLTQSTFNCPGQTAPGCPTDLTGNGYTDTADMLIFLQDFGEFCE